MDERLYSRPLDVHRISDYPEVQRMITYLFDEMKSSGLIGKSPRKKILKHLKVVVLDLYVAYLHDPLVYLGYSRRRDDYSGASRLGQLYLGYRPMIRVVDGLLDLGYLERSGTGPHVHLACLGCFEGCRQGPSQFYRTSRDVTCAE